MKFTDSGRVTLRALLIEEQGEDIVVRFEVQDTGPGLSPEQLERLFQPFEQVDGSAARRHGLFETAHVVDPTVCPVRCGSLPRGQKIRPRLFFHHSP
ncbi:MAG: ATP-binding protein [Verrucomicrobiota bacterium]